MSRNLIIENQFSIEQVRCFWDGVAESYDLLNDQFGETHLQRFKESMEYITPKSGIKILNIWSRTGKAIPFLRKLCSDMDLENLEVSNEFIKIAKENFPKEKFRLTDFRELPFADDYFDYILSLETLEHVPKPMDYLRELGRILKPRGMLIMSLPPSVAEIPLRIYEFFFTNHGEGPHRFYSSKVVKKMLTSARFTVMLHKGTLLIPVGPKWLKRIGEKIINRLQNTFISELGIRQFYICRK